MHNISQKLKTISSIPPKEVKGKAIQRVMKRQKKMPLRNANA